MFDTIQADSVFSSEGVGRMEKQSVYMLSNRLSDRYDISLWI